MNYFQKYQKYKLKYINLKKLIGGELYEFEKITPAQIRDNKDKWLIIRSIVNDNISICKFLNLTEEIPENQDDVDAFDVVYRLNYEFEDVNGKKITHTMTNGYSDAGGSFSFNKIFVIKNLSLDTNPIDKVDEIVAELNKKYPKTEDKLYGDSGYEEAIW